MTSPDQPLPTAPALSERELRPQALKRGQAEAFARDIERLQRRLPEFVTVVCPACGGGGGRTVFEKHGFTYVGCPSCATIYMSPRPSEPVLADYYRDSENYRYWAQHIFPASEAARREKLHRPWLNRIAGLCRRWDVPTVHMVEVGPGFGTFAALAGAEGPFDRITAIEPTPEMAAACRERGVTVIERRIEDADGLIEPADVLVSFEVVEHLFEPRRFIGQCRRILRPGGLLVLSCPNGLGFDIAMLGPRSDAVDPEHINLFNPDSLGLLLGRCGFELLETATPGRLDAELVRTAALAGSIDLSADPFLTRVLVEDWERLGAPFQTFLAENGLSSHMWVVARRPVGDPA